MPVTVIIGGQYGSEGKGKVAYCLAVERNATVAVRSGGPNAGHTVVDQLHHPIILRQLPTAALIPNVKCVLAPGSYIDPEILTQEIMNTGITDDRLAIDPNAVIITEGDKEGERHTGLREAIGSTLSGTGAAVTKRITRVAESYLAKHDARLSRFIRPIATLLRDELSRGARIIVEGTQGFGLSPLHSPNYPYVTSRDTTAAAFLSEVGLSPLDVDQIVMVLRSFPIRVGGNSGPLPFEIDWNTVTSQSGSPHPIVEYTSVTKTVRRVARFDPDIVRSAIRVNMPTHIVLNHLDYIDFACQIEDRPSDRALEFVERTESLIGRSIDYLGFNPSSLFFRGTALARTKFA